MALCQPKSSLDHLGIPLPGPGISVSSMEKPLPKTPDLATGPAIVTVSLVDSTDPEDHPPTPDINEAPPLSSRTRQSSLSFLRRVSQIVGPEQENKPNGSTVIWSVLGFVALLAFGCVAVAYPLRPILITIGIIAFFMLCSLVVLTASDLKSSSMFEYSEVSSDFC